MCIFFFFFNDTATTEIYTLSLHDALPILVHRAVSSVVKIVGQQVGFSKVFRAEFDLWDVLWIGLAISRSEEHTSELQSQSNLVCRLLLEKKTKHISILQSHTNLHRCFERS